MIGAGRTIATRTWHSWSRKDAAWQPGAVLLAAPEHLPLVMQLFAQGPGFPVCPARLPGLVCYLAQVCLSCRPKRDLGARRWGVEGLASIYRHLLQVTYGG